MLAAQHELFDDCRLRVRLVHAPLADSVPRIDLHPAFVALHEQINERNSQIPGAARK